VNVLHIQSSPRGESSNSIALTNAFIDACQSRDNSLVIDTLNVWNENLPEFDSEAIGAKYKAVKNVSMTKGRPRFGIKYRLSFNAFSVQIESYWEPQCGTLRLLIS
jgi:FMN-dependent NADH-azoreductase